MHYEYEILNYTFVPIQVYDSIFVSLLFISAVCIPVFSFQLFHHDIAVTKDT